MDINLLKKKNMSNIELQLVTFKQAKALKELGFPQRPILDKSYDYCYCIQESHSYNSYIDLYEGTLTKYNICNLLCADSIEAPTLELVAKWLREEKGLIVEVNYTYDDTYHWDVIQRKQPLKMKQYGVIPLTDNRTYQNTYEEALSAGIDKAIEILKGE